MHSISLIPGRAGFIGDSDHLICMRIVTGIPQSRMTDILEEKSPVPDGSEDAEALL